MRISQSIKFGALLERLQTMPGAVLIDKTTHRVVVLLLLLAGGFEDALGLVYLLRLLLLFLVSFLLRRTRVGG